MEAIHRSVTVELPLIIARAEVKIIKSNRENTKKGHLGNQGQSGDTREISRHVCVPMCLSVCLSVHMLMPQHARGGVQRKP